MEEKTEVLLKNLDQYETQLSQIRQAITSSTCSTSKKDLFVLEKDIEELISLTKENINSLKSSSFEVSTSGCESQIDSISQEYALFKEELAALEGNCNEITKNEDAQTDNFTFEDIPQELKNDLESLKGAKCQAPYKKQWGYEMYCNALIMDIEVQSEVQDLNQIQVRVMFVNPMERNMLPCPYFLNGECRFTDDNCHFSHGELVPLSDIREYREPDFSSVKVGSQVLAKQKDNLWHRAIVKSILRNDQYLVKFESKGCEPIELDLHNLLPLDSKSSDEDDSSSSESESNVGSQEYFVQLSLLRTPPNVALGAWEKHTKGIGSRLMANMGYVVGCGLGKYGEGRLEPVEAVVYPPGKSLDACINLREAAGGELNLIKASRRQKKKQRHLLRLQKKQQINQTDESKDVFSFINSKLAGSVAPKPDSSHHKILASSSRKGLNVERFRLGENIKKTEKGIERLKQSLSRHESGSLTHSAINNKLEEAQSELNKLKNSDKLFAREQDQRDGCKKMVVF